MTTPRRGLSEGLPYSLSRWTDLPAAKWPWFQTQLAQGHMIGMDPRTGLPDRWSLDPAHTLGLIFWTRNPRNLVRDVDLLKAYSKVVHFTLTGWHEVEARAPRIEEGLDMLGSAIAAFGVDNVTWRFSPVPLVDDVVSRFSSIASVAVGLGLRRVYLSFLQPNDWHSETRSAPERQDLLMRLSAVTSLDLVLCNEDQETLRSAASARTYSGVCEDGRRFGTTVKGEGCGCALSVDPFSQNEACQYGCAYCYSANQATSPRKRNTTRLPIVNASRNR